MSSSHQVPSTTVAAILAAIVAAVGEQNVRTQRDDLAYYGSDRCKGDWQVAPLLIALPKTASEVQAVVKACRAHGVSIVPSGGRTGLAGAAAATNGEVVLSLERMRQVLDVDAAARTLRCESGVTVEQAQQAAAAHGLLYPVDFAAKGTAHIGGSIATNAGGVKVLRYGSTRAWVAGLKVVTADGELLDIGGALVKDNTGYDLRQLFIGSEGTLGIIVEATLRLCAPPRGEVVALCALPDDAAVARLFRHAQGQLPLLAFECFDHGCLQHVLAHRNVSSPLAAASARYVLLEVEVTGRDTAAFEATNDALTLCLADAQDEGFVLDGVIAATGAEARALWALREDTSESLHSHSPRKADVALPVASVVDFLDLWRPMVAKAMPDAEALVFGHVGDGNLHLNILKPERADPAQFLAAASAFDAETYALVERFDGSVSAEHGVGLLKRSHLHHSRSAAEIAMMKAIKHALDPTGLFNPGKVLP